jgi:isoleucyl-tRNA synthetase
MADTVNQKTTYNEYKGLNIPELEKEMLAYWESNDIFKKSLDNRRDAKPFVFYEGPPSANGMPGIHHVISRALKDVFCRYKTLHGFLVNRKAGWDTHGLPIELQVEKKLGITKEDIGKSIGIDEYNKACREDVLKFKDVWDDLTRRIGYWVDLDHPYITYENKYIESVWNLLQKLFDKGYLYKGYTVQPYSPAAGTGLSSHELNQPGTYRDVKDTTIVAQFELNDSQNLSWFNNWGKLYCLAWTTTPWTLPSNTALGIGAKIDYVAVETFNAYTHEKITVIVAEKLQGKYFSEKSADLDMEAYEAGQKLIPFKVIAHFKGAELVGRSYKQLMPYVQPEGKAFEIIAANFVTTEDGTGIVHLAPSFGTDDSIAAKQNGIDSLTLVDKQGRFVPEMGEFAGLYVKNYTDEDETAQDYMPTDVKLVIKLKIENKAFKVEKYEHSYPHCWRTDKPILYYPLESWFVKTTAVKDKLIEKNKTINWKPASTGEGRFGNWLENLVDWNLSRSRFWGTPLPIWRTEDGEETKCIGSIEELRNEVSKAVTAGVMSSNPITDDFDLHRPYIDDILLISDSGLKMTRETDLIDVWFDSGAMPYAQEHYPFEGQEQIDENINFPADFIAEGVDQTRGWFFTLHVIGTMLFDSVAYKNVIANGLVLDKDGNKMSKRLGNTVDPFDTIEKFGADVVRWYMLSNSAPWENLKFSMEGLQETQRRFFGTLHNVYSFFALYANIDNFHFNEEYIKIEERPELDRWILSKLNSLVQTVETAMDDYEPTKATRAIQKFTNDHLSNWYVRLARRRFWKGEYAADKISAYQTLHECLETVSVLMSSFSPFYSDRLFKDLQLVRGDHALESVHLGDFPRVNAEVIDSHLEEKMQIAQDLSSMILGIRKKEKIKVRQPLSKVLIPVDSDELRRNIEEIKAIVLHEVNIKDIEFLDENSSIQIIKAIKPDFKKLGPKVGKNMKLVAGAIANLDQSDISNIQDNGVLSIDLSNGEKFELNLSEVEISSKDMPGWQVSSQGVLTVALDLTITEELNQEGMAREFVNKMQNLRKDSGLQVTDRITVKVEFNETLQQSLNRFNDYICGEILADAIILSDESIGGTKIQLNEFELEVLLSKK